MSHRQLARLAQQLAGLKADSLLRSRRLLESPQGVRVKVDGRNVVSFCSNDYMGLAADPALVLAVQQAAGQMGVGAGASHLITGHHRAHQDFEQAFAAFVGMPAALLFSTGYMASLGVIPALIGRHGEVFADKLNHASLNDAVGLSGAKFSRYAHGSVDALCGMLEKSASREKLIVTDTVFSMDGDLAPIDALLALAEEFDAWLYLDDAHGFGVLGERGEGALSAAARGSDRVIYLATLGKGAGVFGAAVAAHATVIDWLINRARTYIYTTAAPPLLGAALSASLRLIAAGDARRKRLQRNIDRLRTGLHGLDGWALMNSSTPIQPLLVGENQAALALSQQLLEYGLLVPAIRTPTVPRGTARLRISLSAAHTDEDLGALIGALLELNRD
ncbi:MAG TPA: 8-amino-7-oxononanoate synthase [Thiobacillaceae bacterium]|nr:8-amino-7-oxononanoate synthase [Thiobacillaceae bacterium]